MTLPVMEPDLWDRDDTLEQWSRLVDDGPFASLCFGERMAFDNPDTLVLLGAVAAWTSRVRLVTTVIVPQLHEPVPLAKALATADRLSGVRLTVGVGVGGRGEGYRAAEVLLKIGRVRAASSVGWYFEPRKTPYFTGFFEVFAFLGLAKNIPKYPKMTLI